MPTKKLLLHAMLGLCLCGGVAWADDVVLAPDHPDHYTVTKGDTLWGIAARFLRDPWRWTDIWDINPAIKNPHLIYPGDVVTLTWRDGKPVLSLARGGAERERTVEAATVAPATEEANVSALPAVKMSPQPLISDIDSAIPTIPIDVIKPFLLQSRILSDQELNNAPYVVAFADDHSAAGRGDKVYARHVAADSPLRFSIFHRGQAYRNPGAKANEVLGYEATHVADASLERRGEPATLLTTHVYRETLIGDRLLPAALQELDQNFVPRPPLKPVHGKIISVVDGVARAGRYQVVVINVGQKDGVEAGHVLLVQQSGTVVRDHVTAKKDDKWVTLPDERAGLLMVFRPFEQVSYGLIMSAEREIRLYDNVINP